MAQARAGRAPRAPPERDGPDRLSKYNVPYTVDRLGIEAGTGGEGRPP